ncbi:CASP C terminal-domain-containing protein [Melanogaster broomeanus]|nr:CASP C terminal-domain-containing protein [Melanogaster broomeanus]
MSSADQHNFSGALATWKAISLHELQKTLDAQGVEIVENQKENVLSRKGLAERTKEFKKIPDDEKVNSFKGLLKAYQQEIDNLTKRSKTAESAFLNVYKVLAEAPDPYPLLEAVLEQTITSTANASLSAEVDTLKAEVARLKGENAELRKENGTLENSKRRVETLEGKMDDLIAEKVAQKENELNATYDERMRNYEEREQDLTRQVTVYKSQLRDLRLSNETNQARLLDASSRADQDLVSRLAEADMVLADLERANSRVAVVEGRNEALRADIEALRAESENSELITNHQSRLSTLESNNSDLTAQLLSTQAQLSATQAQLTKYHEEGAKREEREVAELMAAVSTLKKKLESYADYDEYVEFGGLDDDASDADVDDWSSHDSEAGLRLPDPNADKANAQHGKSLEVLLASKNKRILEELTRFRILHRSLEESLRSTQSELDTTRAELSKQSSLNEKLETDLLALDNRPPHPARGGGDGTVDSDDPLSGLGLDLGLENIKSKQGETSGSTTRSTPIPFTSSADTSILPIVTSQRDRFRARNAELEEASHAFGFPPCRPPLPFTTGFFSPIPELRRQFHTISELRSEIKSLQSDNLKLYEKVRYMQSYRETSSVSQLDPLPGTSRSHRNAASERDGSGLPMGDGVDGDELELGKWRKRYEETMNPFEAFKGREATQAYTALPLPERLLLRLTRSVLGHRRARLGFVCYATTLHLLVVWVVWGGWGCWGEGGTGGYVDMPRPHYG